ncbi:Clp protease N-terminal domain-containing protein [Streptomyces sp. NPDC056161]|uniref:Clp protease N-terminal domain-containing protein n=1 Tax=Streptomyces sp. NPDC056161 TaxID=3345732 RepID=UPI0035D848E0
MGQRGTTETAIYATEFEQDVMDLLVETLRRAVRREEQVVGTDTLLGELVLGDWEAGETIAPGMRKAGSLSGLIAARAGRGWVSDDEVHGDAARDAAVASARTGERAYDEADAEADRREVGAAWREARWRHGLATRRSDQDGGRELPGMTGGLRACLLLALRSARAEGTVAVRCRHVARALLELPGTRAREALVLEKLDTAAAATALDTLDAGASVETERPESRGVTVLRRSGTLGRSGNRLSRALYSWTAQSSANGSPVVVAVTIEAGRWAARHGRAKPEPVDLLLGILALDRALSVVGRSLPGNLAYANAAPEVLRAHGVPQVSLVAAVAEIPFAALPEGGGDHQGDDGQGSPLSAADRVVAIARLSAAEHGSPTVGTVHLLAALLDERTTRVGADPDPGPDSKADTDTDTGTGTDAVVRLLAAAHVDVPALRAELRLRQGES